VVPPTRGLLRGGIVVASQFTDDQETAMSSQLDLEERDRRSAGSIQLGDALSGQVLAPGDPGYDEARRIHNRLIDKHPALIARCLHTADVVDAVTFGREEGLEISVRGGGHNVAGKAVTDGGLMIDLSLMKGIHVDPARRTVRAQAGVRVGELDRAAAAFGLATPSGVISLTGIAGLTLGGGIAWLMGKYGMAVDNLLSAEVVLASGAVVTASEDTDPDLFWALRGGGGNFGVVTSFEFRAHPVASVLGGVVLHPLAAAPQLFSFFRDFAADLPDELSLQAPLLHAPDGSGTTLCGIALCHAGDDADRAEADVRPLREFGSPAADMVQRMPYPVVNTGVDWLFPGARGYWKSAFFSELSDPAVEEMTAAIERAPSELCALVIEEFHGAVTRVAPTATAYPHREPGFNLLLISQWTDPAQTDAGIAWARETFDALSPFMADRSYTNYLSADDHDRVRQAYGPNYERLAELKQKYDPANLFKLNQNIPSSDEPE
jgi:FAD/FMN-containing dehydrogenase